MRLLLPALTVLMLAGCQSEPTAPDGGRVGDPTFAIARVAGADFRSLPGQAIVQPFLRDRFRFTAVAPLLPDLNQQGISFVFDSDLIGADQPLQAELQAGFVYVNTFASGRLYRLDSLQQSRVNLTRIDPFNRRVAGRFLLHVRRYDVNDGVIRPTDELLKISDGAFDLPLIVEGVR